jgi:hypothetical protein
VLVLAALARVVDDPDLSVGVVDASVDHVVVARGRWCAGLAELRQR